MSEEDFSPPYIVAEEVKSLPPESAAIEIKPGSRYVLLCHEGYVAETDMRHLQDALRKMGCPNTAVLVGDLSAIRFFRLEESDVNT